MYPHAPLSLQTPLTTSSSTASLHPVSREARRVATALLTSTSTSSTTSSRQQAALVIHTVIIQKQLHGLSHSLAAWSLHAVVLLPLVAHARREPLEASIASTLRRRGWRRRWQPPSTSALRGSRSHLLVVQCRQCRQRLCRTPMLSRGHCLLLQSAGLGRGHTAQSIRLLEAHTHTQRHRGNVRV